MSTTAAVAWPAWAQLRVEISGVGATQIPVALAPFREQSQTGVALSAIIKADLERSGAFRIIDGEAGLDERSTVDLPAWRGRGVDALVAGSAQRLADGRFDVRYKLWDAVRGDELLGQSKVVLAADLRLAAHRIADEIHEKLTGDKGVFATRIAYVLRTGKRHTLHVTDPDGEGGQIALASPESIISPAWSPDGKKLAYVSFETQKAAVWVQDVTTGERRMVANFRGSNSAPAWSPDGQRLVVTLSLGGPAQLYSIPATGGSPTRLTTSNAIDTEAVFSPDGRHVYFVSDRGGSPQVYRVPSSGGPVERITFSGDYNISPTVSPDGKQLAYVTRQSGGFRLMLLEVGATTPVPLTDTRDDESPSFAPNGRLLVYATRSQGADVLMTTTLDGKIKTRLLSTGADMREPAWGPFGR
ncbi:MAG: Tol-Pal system beta propeller repeat protein TolB [Rubrivivax sp.]|nr:Tol-Pal system beta propeller repeat protein TolB [Rubrivivax sp.]